MTVCEEKSKALALIVFNVPRLQHKLKDATSNACTRFLYIYSLIFYALMGLEFLGFHSDLVVVGGAG